MAKGQRCPPVDEAGCRGHGTFERAARIQIVLENRSGDRRAQHSGTRANSQLLSADRIFSEIMQIAKSSILGRKLYAVLEKRPGKIDSINPGIASNLVEIRLSLHYTHARDDSHA